MIASRRQLLALGAGAALGATLVVTMRAALAAAPAAFAAPALPPVEVWKSPTCGCCAKSVEHLEANGFKVQVRDQGNTAARQRAGIAQALGSCHTALVGGYAIEGHVPPQTSCACSGSAQPRLAWPCLACRLAHPAWSKGTSVTAMTCCWSRAMARPAFLQLTNDGNPPMSSFCY